MPDCQDTGEPVLVALAQNGDQDALEVLLRRYYRPLRAFIAPMVGTSHADDVLQEIALAIFQNKELFARDITRPANTPGTHPFP